jgi:MFS transporter, LPLT family, lysophospholipid transporter
MIAVYIVAAMFNLRIPHTGVAMQKIPDAQHLFPEFWDCNRRLWRDKLGQISLATTTLFWGVAGNLRYIVLAWAAAALTYDTATASKLVGVVAIGTAVGAVLASMKSSLDRATNVIPLGIGMGLTVILMIFISDVKIAIPFLILLGALGGYLVVPMNALLQHRGHMLMGAGRSIAVQNFNEQACILGLGAFYALLTGLGMSAFGAITMFGLVVAITMFFIRRWHESNKIHHKAELDRLLAIARSDKH